MKILIAPFLMSLILAPREYTPDTSWPVILFLHGAGERGSDGVRQTEVGLGAAIRTNPERWPAIVVFPQVPENRSHVWLPGEVAMAARRGKVSRFDVFLVSLNPVGGSEIRKTRPCLIISPDETNRHLRTVIVAPMTTKGRDYPTRVACTFQGKTGQVVLGWIRTIDKSRLVRRLGEIDLRAQRDVVKVLGMLFGYAPIDDPPTVQIKSGCNLCNVVSTGLPAF